MIKVEFENVRLVGTVPMLATELENALRDFRHALEEDCGKDGAMDFLNNVIANSFLEDEERRKKAKHDSEKVITSEANEIDELFKPIMDFLNRKENKKDDR